MTKPEVLDSKVYFNSSFEDVKRNYFTNTEKISKIRLFLDNKGIAQPLSSLFGKY